MEVSSKPHHELVTQNFHEDFREEEEDDEENRFIISLDDIDMKDEFLDDIEQTPPESNNVEKVGQGKREAQTVNLPKVSSLTESTNLTCSSINDTGKSCILFQVPKDGKLVSTDSSCQNKGVYMAHSDVDIEKGEQSFMKNIHKVNESSKISILSHTSSSDTEELSFSGMNSVDTPIENSITQSAPVKKCRLTTKNRSFTSQQNCSCIMCYQGRGIIDSNHIPKAAKRKVEMPPNDIPVKTKKLPSVNFHASANESSSLQNLINQKLSSSASNSSATSLYTIPTVNSVTKSLLVKPQIQQNLLPSSSSVLVRNSNNPSNYVFIVPSTSGSSEIKTASIGNSLRPQKISTPGHQVNPPLPILTPKPCIPSTVAPTVTISSVVSNLSSQANFTMTSQSSPLIYTPSTKINTAPTEKAQIVVVNKSSLEKQITDLNGILKRATKVDLSSPGMVLVHFKPTAQTSVTSSSTNSPFSPSLSSNRFPPDKVKSTSPHYMENALYGLVKNHLIQPSSSNKNQNTSRSSPVVQNDISAKHRQTFISKPQWQYSLVNGKVMPTSLNSRKSFEAFPPPPPLTPRPGCSQSGRTRPVYDPKVILNQEEQTETLVLPLPKNYQERSAGNLNVDISKQDEMLLSPNLFTFSSPFELSPQKTREQTLEKWAPSNDSAHQSINGQQPSVSFQNQIHSYNPISSPSSLATHASVVVETSHVASLSFPPEDAATQSYATHDPNSMCLTSSSVMPQKMIQSNSTGLQVQEIPINSDGHKQAFSGLGHLKTSNLPPSLEKDKAQMITGNSNVTSLSSSASPSLSGNNSYSSSVSIVSGLKMKIRLKESMMEEKDALHHEEHRISSKLNEPLMESSSSQSISGDASTEIGDTVVCHSSTDTTTSINEAHLAGSVDKTGHVETAEEMFKRFEDQAMRQVYNAQFGVGDVHRSLRPNRTTTATNDFLYVHSRKSGEFKKKKTDENKSNPDIPISKTEDTTSIDKNVRKINRKRSLSGEGRQKGLEEKSIKLDINQYPKLMQDNSILNSKTIYTPNILAGHKVYVKFNVFSNIQSSRSFLVPFFNIGGSRTQFDVEDIEYINRAVAEFEKEEKSCARHLLYYSREGQKAVFLRKESRLHSDELSSKSYKKCSFILEGYKRERSKQVYEPPEEWKVDNQVQIEIDRAEQDSEIKVSENQDVNEMPCEDAKSKASETYKSSSASSVLINLLARSTPLDVTQTDPLSSSLSGNNVNGKINFGGVKSASDLVIGNKKIKSSHLVPNECASHRDKVNILKRQSKVNRTYCSPALQEKSKLVPETCYTEKLKELVMSGVLENNLSSSSSCETLQKQISTSSKDHNHSISNDNSSSGQHNSTASQNLPHIKTEVQDDGYDFALSGKQKEPHTSADSTGVNIKSEPIDDYTESLARRMNVLLQNDRQTLIKPTLSGRAENSSKLEKLSAVNHVQSLKEQKSTDTGTVSSNNELNSPSKDTGITLPLAVDVQKSLSNKNSETDSSFLTDTATADECQFSESENAADSLTNVDSFSVSESSDITSSSDVETSQEEKDEEMSSLTMSRIEGPARDKSTANNKITSLVESLKQRLNQDCVAVPEFLSCSEQKKKRQKKKKKRMDSISKNSREKAVASFSNSISMFPSVHSSASVNVSKQLSSDSSNITSDTTSECKNDINKSVIDSQLELSLPSTSSLSSLSILKSSSTSNVAYSKKVNDESSIQAKATSLSMGSASEGSQDSKIDIDTTHKEIACSSASENLKETNSALPLCSDHLTVDTHKVCDKINVINNKNSNDSQHKSEKLKAAVEKCELKGDSNDWQETFKKKCDRFKCSSTSSSNSHLKDILQDFSSQNKRDDTRKEQVREDEVQFKQEFDSNPSTPCSEIEIDVGSEEVLVENPVKKNPVASASLLSSPPVPSFGRRHIKDFAREHDLMLPLVTVPDLKSKLNCIIDQNIKNEEGSSPNNSSFYKNTADSKKSAKSKYVRVLKKSPKAGLKVKQSVASILCKKLDIEVEPVIPQTKLMNGAPVLSKTKIFTAEDRQTPSPGNKSFNRPTLNAIFGVDHFSMPPSASKDGEEEVNDVSTVVTQQKPRARQVAIKGTHSSKAADRTNKRLQKRQLKTKSYSPKNAPKGKSKTGPMKGSRIKTKSQVSSDRRVIQKQKRYNLQTFFRTWRQLSHEQKNRQNMKHEHQQVRTIPCKVVLQRIEDMHLDSNGQPVVKENISTCDKNDSTDNNQDRENRFINVKKRKKKAIMRIPKRRGISKDKKKDIVDYYASMLETLRKKAQLLEEEAIREEMKKAEEIKSEPLIKIEPIEEQLINSRCNSLNGINDEDTEIRSEQLQDKENNTKMEIISSQDNKIEFNKLTEQIGSEILDSSSAEEANNSTYSHETSKEEQATQIEISEKNIVDSENMDQEHTVPKECDNSNDSNCSDKEKLKTHLSDVDNVNTSALEPIACSSTVSCFAKENTQSCMNSNSYLSDSSEVGRLVIDYDSEQDHKNDTDTEGSCVEEEKKLKGTSIPHDISDLMSDSSFRTKDIVLGFENELGADTVISTLSQSDMDDMFLLEDDEDKSPIGMIPEDEVEKLLGLDVTGEGDASKHEKNDSKNSTSASSMSHSPGTLENYKLHWTPIMEVPNGNSGSTEKNVDSEAKQSLSTVDRMDESITNLSPPNDLQMPLKNCQISPSWNRLLGSEALKKMEKSAVEETFSSSIQSSSEHQNRDSVSNGKLKLKFCAGALSKALKLSAEMKKVLSEGSAPESAADQQLAGSKKGSAGPQKTQDKKYAKDMSNSHNVDSDNDKFSSSIVKEKRCIVQQNMFILSEKPKTSAPDIVQQHGSIDSKGSKICVTPDCQEVNSFGLGNKSEKLSSISVISSSIPNEDKISSVNQYPETSDVSQASSSAIDVKSKSLPLNTKIIDLNKLKLKLNPLLSKSANKKKLPESSNLNYNDMTVPLTSDEDPCTNKVLTTEFQYKRQPFPKVKAGSDSEDVVSKNTCNLSLRKETSGQNIGKTGINTLPLKKPMKNSEPSLLTSKLCSILKNVKKPTSGPKESTAEMAFSKHQNIEGKLVLSEQDHSSVAGNNRRLRSSPRLPQSHNNQEAEKLSSSLISDNESLEGSEKILKKGDDEEKGGRSFFDCLSDVIPRTTWDET